VSDKEVGIKITLKGDGWRRGLTGLENETKAAGKRMGASLSESMTSGVRKAGSSLKAGLGGVKDALGPVASFGGLGAMLGVGALVNDSAQAEQKLRNLAFVMTKTGGAAYSYANLQSKASEITKKWGTSTEDLTAAMDSVFQEVGDPKLAVNSLDAIATASRATGKSVGTLAEIAGSMGEQFAVGPEEMGDGLAHVIDQANKGGIKIDEVGGAMGRLGRAARLAGVSGVDGMTKTLALANALEGSAGGGAQAVELLAGSLGKLDAGKAQRKALAGMGIKTTDAKGNELNGIDLLGSIMKTTKGDATQLGKIFKPEQAVAFSESFSGGKFDEALSKAGESSISYADIQKQAQENMQTSAAKFETALNVVKDKFASPEVVKGIGKLTDAIPKLADVIVKAVDFVTKSPVTTAALLLGKSALPGMFKAGFGGDGGGGGGGGGGPGSGGGGGKGGGVGSALGAAPAIITTALAAYAIGSEQIDNHFKEREASETRQLGAGFGAANIASELKTGTFTTAERHAKNAEARTQLANVQDRLDDIAFASTGGANINDKDRREAAASRYKTGGAYTAGEGELKSLLQQREDLQSGLATYIGPSIETRRAIVQGKAGTENVDIGVGDSSTGGGFIGLMTGPGGKRKRRGAIGGLAVEADTQAEQAPAAKDTTGLLQQIATANQELSNKVSSGLDVRISNVSELTAALNGNQPGYAPHN
jgi:TP901 family phage tail tape measure protein